jgi:undecaprenyl-phosphate 4-deoxy-4-formamido-L-arabinose transferase
MQRTLSVVVPVYNSAPILPSLVLRLEPVLRSLSQQFELVLVDDDSSDESWSTVQGLAQANDWLRGIHLMRNCGQHNALLCGIRAARHSIVVTIDDDLQNPPEELDKLLALLDQGFDVVYGTPQLEQHGFWRNVASRVTKLALQSTMGAETARKVSAFRAFRTDLRRAFADYKSQFVSIDVLLTWATTRFASVPVRHDPRRVGKSNYTFRKLIVHAVNMLTGFSVFPLQIASITGFALTAFGLVLLVYVIGRLLWLGTSIPGFPFLASVISIFSGAQLFALGIMGEYLARIHFRTMDRPPYAVGASTDRLVPSLAPEDSR